MSKKEITSSEEEVQSSPDAAPEVASQEAPSPDAPAEEASAPEVAAEEAVAQEEPAPVARKSRAKRKPASEPSSEAEAAVEEAAVEEAPAEEASTEQSAAEGGSESESGTEKSDESGEVAETDAGETDAEAKPRTRTRTRRSRSRRKSKDGEKSDDNGDEKTRSREGGREGGRDGGRGRGRGRNRRNDRDDDASNQSENGDVEQGPKDKLRATALWGLHTERKAKMVAFAGYEMPVQYKRGIMAEHRQTRDRAGLFDVSHMGQAFLTLEGDGGHEEIAALMEELVSGDIRGLKSGGIRYTLLLDEEGGIIDDLMVTRPEGDAGNGMLFLVVNAGCKDKDFAHIAAKLEGRAKLTVAGDRALIALQGPTASKNLSRFAPFVAEMAFMTAKACRIDGIECLVSRCGYTGEDGFEISVPNEQAEPFARKLLTQRDVSLVGLGARDSLRLESGLCLYGHDIDEETTPAEAGLMWTIPKRRKEAKDFPGAEKVMGQVAEGTTRKRVGIKPEGKAPARDGTEIVDSEGKVIGKVTSGGFGPTVRGPIAMGYVETAQSEEGTEVGLMVRGQSRPAKIVTLPFIQPRQYRPGQEPAVPAPEPEEEVVPEEAAVGAAAETPDDEVSVVAEETSPEAPAVEEEAVAEVSEEATAEEAVEAETEDATEDKADDDGESEDERP